MNKSSVTAGRQNIPLVFVLAGVLMAILFGLISVTANPILVSFAVAMVVGLSLLTKPSWIMWLVLSLGLLVTGILPLYVSELATKAAWGVSLLCFLLMFLAFFRAATFQPVRKDTPAFIWVAFFFFIYALLNSLIQWHSAGEFFGGFKRYFQMWGILFALCWLAFEEQIIRRWRTFVAIVALVQLPFAVHQLMVWVPLREGLRNSNPGMVPIDVVAGTFGANITSGGANAEMATFLIIVFAFLLVRLREKIITLRSFVFISPIILVPLFLGETKVVLVLFPLMLLVLYRWELITRPHLGLMVLALGTTFTVIVGYAYVNITGAENYGELFEDTLSYNVYNIGHGNNYLNRTTVLTFWAEHQGAHDPVSFIFGNGLGSSHTATAGHVAMYYPWHGIGLTAASTLLWDLGIFGFGLFVTILALAWRCAGRLRRESVVPVVRADAAAIQVALVLFGFYLFYRIALLEALSFQIIFAVLLGYLAWLHRRHIDARADNSS